MGIKRFILNLPFVKQEIRDRCQHAIFKSNLYNKECQEGRDQRLMELKTGMPIIVLTEETTPELAIITGWLSKDVPIVNVYSNRIIKEYTLFSTYIPYNAQNFELLYRMKKSEALGLISPVYQERGVGFKIKNEDNRDGRVYLDTVKDAQQNGFFEKAKEYWTKQRGMKHE